MPIKAFKFKLYRSNKNQKLQQQLNIACEIWNYCISMQRKSYEWFNTQIHKYDLQHRLVLLKKRPVHAHWNKLMAKSIEDIVNRIDLAYKAFFRNIKQKKKASIPHFISRKHYKSFSYQTPGKNLTKDGKIRINGVWYNIFDWREIEGTPKQVTVSKDSTGDFWVVVTCELQDEYPQPTDEFEPAVGLDFGLGKFLTSSDGKGDIDEPKFLMKALDKLKKKCRKFSAKKPGSHNSERARLELARLHRNIANQRDYFQWQAAGKLVNMYKTICIEDLDLHGMMEGVNKKLKCRRNIHDLSFASFVEKLKYLASKKGVRVIQAGRWYPSSQICHKCGHKNPQMKNLSNRTLVCTNCGETIDRDRSAAINILNEGLRTLRIPERG